MLKKNQMEFKLKLSSIRTGGKNSNKQLTIIANIMKFYKSQEKVIKCYNHYFKMVHKATYDTKHGKGRKILTPKQKLQRAGNTS